MKISGCLIVKNEEVMLERCLRSLKGVDSIVVCDTGSIDNTIGIAKLFSDWVFTDYVWADNFSEARNYALSKVDVGSWCISIDGDEELITPISEIRKQIEKAEKEGFNALNVNLVWRPDMVSKHTAPRIFKKLPETKWVGAMHECIACNAMPSDVTILFEASPSHAHDPERSFRILKKAVDLTHESRDTYYLAREYYYKLDYIAALYYWEEYIKISDWRYEKADAYLMCAQCLWILQRGDEARDHCLKAILLNPEFREAFLLMAEMSFEKEKATWKRLAQTTNNNDVLFTRVRYDENWYSGSYPGNRALIFDIIKGLKPKSILDMGVGTGFYGQIIRKGLPDVKLDGVEIFPSYRNELWENYNNITIDDIRTVPLGEYDLYLMVDIIEHMTKDDGLKLLRKMKGPVLISTPRDYDQDEVHGNVYQKHLYKWKIEDFAEFKITDYSNELSIIIVIGV